MASWPRTTKAPRMALSLVTPKTLAQPKMYLREASRRVKKPVIRLEEMKGMVSSSLYLYSQRQREYSSNLQFSQNQGRATSRVSSLENLRFLGWLLVGSCGCWESWVY